MFMCFLNAIFLYKICALLKSGAIESLFLAFVIFLTLDNYGGAIRAQVGINMRDCILYMNTLIKVYTFTMQLY